MQLNAQCLYLHFCILFFLREYDWAWPNESGPPALGQISEEFEYKMRDLFWQQDKHKVRTNFKSIVELKDRGLEFCNKNKKKIT